MAGCLSLLICKMETGTACSGDLQKKSGAAGGCQGSVHLGLQPWLQILALRVPSWATLAQVAGWLEVARQRVM